MAARLGKGLKELDSALVLQCEHWLEATDPSHRYGSLLRPYFEHWLASQHSDTEGLDQACACELTVCRADRR